MLKTKELELMTVAVPKEYKEELIKKIGEEGIVHLKEVEEDFSPFKIDEDEKKEIELNYLYYNTVIKWFVDNGIVFKEVLENLMEKIKPFEDRELIKKANEVITKLLNKIRRLENLDKELLITNKKLKFLKALSYFGVETLDELKTKEVNIYFFILSESEYKNFEKLKQNIPGEIREYYNPKLKEYYILIISEEKINFPYNNLINEILESFQEEENKIHQLLEKYSKKAKDLQNEKEKLNKELKELFENYKYIILPAYKYYKIQMEKILSSQKIKESRDLVILQGYIPKEKENKVKELLENNFKDNYLVEFSPVGKEAPSLIEHKQLKPYQDLVEMYGTIRYNWFDPTIVFAVVFSLFYGFIIGDIGYGLVMIILAYLLKRTKGLIKISQVLFIGGLSSMFFGLLFGEFFSLSLYNLIERTEPKTMLNLILFSVVFGLAYLIFGAFISMYFGIKNRDYESFYSGLIFTTFFAGIIGLAVWYYFKVTPLLILSLISLLISVLVTIKEHGVIGLLDFSGFIGNVLSFARLAALGIAGSFMGFLINKLAEYLISKGVILGVIGILLAILLHSLNIIFSLVGGAIHSLRLQYLEFFSRFYKEGKEKFRGFGESANKIED